MVQLKDKQLSFALWSVYGLISAIYIFAGSIHLDEGAYMYASKAVYAGKLLYKDFFFLQPPVHPYLYGLIQLVLPGLLFARLTSVALGIITTITLQRLTSKVSGIKNSEFMFLALISLSSFQLYFFSITRLYALTACFIALGCYFLFNRETPSLHHGILAVVFFALAVCSRLTVIPMFLYSIIYVGVKSKQTSTKLLAPLAGGITLSIVYLPFLINVDIQQLWFNLLGMNLSLHSNNIQANLIQKARATRQLLQFYFPVWFLFIPLIGTYVTKLNFPRIKELPKRMFSPEGGIWVLTMGMLLVHTSAKLYQVSYQTIVMPLLMCGISIAWTKRFSCMSTVVKKRSLISLSLLLIIGLLAYGRTSISIINGKPALLALWEQADFVEKHTKPEDMIFTADSALVATEAGRDVLPGMAGSDLFADWSTEKCLKYRVLNFDILNRYIQDQTGQLLAYGDMSFNLSLPRLEPVPEIQRSSLMTKLQQRYSKIQSFPNLMLPGTEVHYCQPTTDRGYSPKKLFIFGIDAAAWDVVKPMCDQGMLPNLSALKNSGFSAHMKTLNPTVSVMLWTTIATGMLPENHGINNWLSEGMDTSGQLAITSDRRQVPAFWNITGDQRVFVANWWATWPVEAVNGTLVSNRAHFPDLTHTVYPDQKTELLKSIKLRDRSYLESELTALNPARNSLEISEFFYRQLARDHYYLELSQTVLTQENFDIAAVFIRGIDILEHEYLRDVNPSATSIPDIPEEQQGIVQAYYRYVDNWIGEFKSIMGPDTAFLIVSDHGMDPVDKLPPLIEGLDINKLLQKLSILSNGDFDTNGFVDNRRYPPGLKRGIAWSGTKDLPESLCNQLIRQLKNLEFSGKPLFTRVERGTENGECILLDLNPEPEFRSVINWKNHEFPIMAVTSMIIHPRSGQHWHAPDGLFVFSGPGIKMQPGINHIDILDIMPTFSAFMNLPIADNLDGSPRTDLFTSELLKERPLKKVSSYPEKQSIQHMDTPDEIDKSIRAELESLGYIQN